jgi:hypothetical protein
MNEDATKFDPEEQPTNPSAPAPEELAMHTWLASETRAIGPLRSSTSRFRAICVVAVEGGVARVSHIDVVEANAQARVEDQPDPPPEPPAAPAEVAAPLPSQRPPPNLGPRGTVRMVVRPDLGPTGTVRIRPRPPAVSAKDADDRAERRALRVRWVIIGGFVLLCTFDVASISMDDGPPPAVIVPTQTAAPTVQVASPVQPAAPATTTQDSAPVVDTSAAPSPAARPTAPPPARRTHKRTPSPASVF